MKNLKFLLLLLLTSSIIVTGCGDDEEQIVNESLDINFTGLEDLGNNFAYEGWIMVDGSPISAGIFTVDANGTPSQTSFDINADDLEKATAYILTIEPSPDNDPAPSAVHILAGDFDGDDANLTVSHAAAIGTNFTDATGSYILATPTDGGAETNENSGVWWLDPAGPSATLGLPTLPDGWKYEGWAVIDGVPVSTGTFTSATGADDAANYSGTAGGPPFPGEDFLMNAPSGLTFPVDLSGRTVVISVEPSPDNSPAPFLLKPLVGQVPANAATHSLHDMNNNATATNPVGSVAKIAK